MDERFQVRQRREMTASGSFRATFAKMYAFFMPYSVAMAVIGAVTLIFLSIRPHIYGKPGTVAFVEVIVVLLIGKRWGRQPALFTSVIGAISWNHFFLHLNSVVTLSNIQNWALFITYLITSIVIGQWAAQAMQRVQEAEKSQQEIKCLYINLQRENAQRESVEALLRKVPEELKLRVQERTQELKSANEQLELEIQVRRHIEQELLESREQVRARSAHLEAIREEERKHIAMEIHDELGQLLTALKMDLSLLRNTCAHDEEMLEKVGNIRDLVEKTILVVRNVATQLRPGALNLGIVPAIEWLAENFSQRNHINCKTDIRCGEIRVPDVHATIIFRIVQESLTNIMRHAAASNVWISLTRDGNVLELEIKDDGKGFNMETVEKGVSHGLFGIRERARLINACLSIDSVPGKGTRLLIRIPFENGEPQ